MDLGFLEILYLLSSCRTYALNVPGFRIRINLIWIRIQNVRLNTNPDPDPIRVFTTKKKKCTAEKKIALFLIKKTTIYLSLGLHKGRPSYKKKPSDLKREHPALQNMKYFFFSTFVGNFCPPGSGSTDLIESGSGSETLKCTVTSLHPEVWTTRDVRLSPLIS